MRNLLGEPWTCGPAQTSPPNTSRPAPGSPGAAGVPQLAGPVYGSARLPHGNSASGPEQPSCASTNGLNFEQSLKLAASWQGTPPRLPSASGLIAVRSAILAPVGQSADSNAPRSNCSGEQTVKPGRPARPALRRVSFSVMSISL